MIYYKVIILDEVRPKLEVRINTNYLGFSYKCESIYFESTTDVVINDDFDIDYDKTLHNFDNKLHTDFENFLNNFYRKNDEIMLSTIELLKQVLK